MSESEQMIQRRLKWVRERAEGGLHCPSDDELAGYARGYSDALSPSEPAEPVARNAALEEAAKHFERTHEEWWSPQISAAIRSLKYLAAPASEDKRDAERYRWLRSHHHSDVSHRLVWYLPRSEPLDENGLDAAIDAALRDRGGQS